MKINDLSPFDTVKVLMLKGEKGDTGAGSYDDTEIKRLLADETSARATADTVLESRIDEIITGSETQRELHTYTLTNDSWSGSLPYTYTQFEVELAEGEEVIEAVAGLQMLQTTYKTGVVRWSAGSNSTLFTVLWVDLNYNNSSEFPDSWSGVVASGTCSIRITTAKPVNSSPNAELEDIRIGYDGTEYESAGDAVRGQIEQVIDMIMPDSFKETLLYAFSHVTWDNNILGGYAFNALQSELYPPEGLRSISATYTAGTTIHTTDDLDDLREGLAVYANYGLQIDQIHDYALSGVLNTGTSTITVYYGGKSTTFNVTVA